MDVIEINIIVLWGANKFWGIPVTSLFDHLHGKIRSKKIRPQSVITGNKKKKKKTIVTWVLNM
jgi:hypothetical protein